MTDCPHKFFLQDFVGNSERINVEVGNDWRVTCGNCGESFAGSRSFKSEPIALRWTNSSAWFGRLEEIA
jgi:hypothetical protein